MFTRPSYSTAKKAICSSCSLRAACRTLSTTPSLADRLPLNVRKARHDSRIQQHKPSVEADKDLQREIDQLPFFDITHELSSGLQRLGFSSILDVVKTLRLLVRKTSKLPLEAAFTGMTTNSRYFEVAEKNLGTLDLALLKDSVVRRKALHLLGQTYLHDRNKKIALDSTRFILLAFSGGEVDAGIDAAAAEQLMNNEIARFHHGSVPTSLLSPKMFDLVRKTALLKQDYRAMTLYIYEMSKRRATKETARECYHLALDLCNLVKPSRKPKEDHPWYLERGLAPSWDILYFAATRYLTFLPKGAEYDQVEADASGALRDGVDNYTDPHAITAALRDSKVVPRHSAKWVDLATQGAAAGFDRPAFDLAIYHLGRAGWRPKKRWQKPTDWTGIQWLAASAANSRSDQSAMLNKYLGLAYLLREHGFMPDAYSWMEFAREHIGEAGLDPTNEIKETINNIVKSWKAAETDKSWEKHMQSSEELLAPYLDEQDRLPKDEV